MMEEESDSSIVDSSYEELILVAKRFKKFLKTIVETNFLKWLKSSQGKKEKSSQGIQCHECSSYGHIQTKCSNYKKSMGNAMNVTLSNESDFDDSE